MAMPLPAKRVRIKARTPRTPQIPQPKHPLLFPGIINEKTVLCLKTRPESAAQEYYHERVHPLSCAHDDNYPEFREGIRLFRRLLYKTNSKLKPQDPILPDISGPDVTSQHDIRIYLPIDACALKPVEDDWGYVKLKIKKASNENETDLERTAYFREELSADGHFVNCHLVCQKLVRGFQLALQKKKQKRRRKRKRRSRSQLSGISETNATDAVAMEMVPEKQEQTEVTKVTTDALINGILGTGLSLKRRESTITENQIGEQKESTGIPITNDNIHEPSDKSAVQESEANTAKLNSAQEKSDQNIDCSENDQNETNENPESANNVLAQAAEADESASLHIELAEDISSKNSRPETTDSDRDFESQYGTNSIITTEYLDNDDLDGPDDFSDLAQLTVSSQNPTRYPIIHYHDYRYHVIPAIKVRRSDCDMYIGAAYCNDQHRESTHVWRKSYFNRERFIFRTMQAADGGNRLKIYEILSNLVKIDKAMSIMDDDTVLAAMLHDFDHRVDETPRWQRNNLESSFVSVLQTLNDILGVDNGIPHFFIKQVNLLENVPLLQIARLKGRIRSLISSPSVLERAFKLQPSISESFDY